MYLGAPMLGAYILTIVISSSWIDPLVIHIMPFFFFLYFGILFYLFFIQQVLISYPFYTY